MKNGQQSKPFMNKKYIADKSDRLLLHAHFELLYISNGRSIVNASDSMNKNDCPNALTLWEHQITTRKHFAENINEWTILTLFMMPQLYGGDEKTNFLLPFCSDILLLPTTTKNTKRGKNPPDLLFRHFRSFSVRTCEHSSLFLLLILWMFDFFTNRTNAPNRFSFFSTNSLSPLMDHLRSWELGKSLSRENVVMTMTLMITLKGDGDTDVVVVLPMEWGYEMFAQKNKNMKIKKIHTRMVYTHTHTLHASNGEKVSIFLLLYVVRVCVRCFVIPFLFSGCWVDACVCVQWMCWFFCFWLMHSFSFFLPCYCPVSSRALHSLFDSGFYSLSLVGVVRFKLLQWYWTQKKNETNMISRTTH